MELDVGRIDDRLIQRRRESRPDYATIRLDANKEERNERVAFSQRPQVLVYVQALWIRLERQNLRFDVDKNTQPTADGEDEIVQPVKVSGVADDLFDQLLSELEKA